MRGFNEMRIPYVGEIDPQWDDLPPPRRPGERPYIPPIYAGRNPRQNGQIVREKTIAKSVPVKPLPPSDIASGTGSTGITMLTDAARNAGIPPALMFGVGALVVLLVVVGKR